MGTRRTIPQVSPPPTNHLKYYLPNTFEKYKPFTWEKTIQLSQIDSFISLLNNNQNVTISKFNDGEWAYAFSLEDLKLPSMKSRNKGYEKEMNYAGEKIANIIKSIPKYYISIDKITLTNKQHQSQIYSYFKPLNFIGSGVFNTWSMYTGFKDLFKICNQRKTVIVGPEFLKDLPFHFIHYKIPLTGVNWEIDKYTQEIEDFIENIWEPNMIILYSCSLLAKISLDNLFQKYGNSITQLDIGASFNPFVGFKNRPWHNIMIDEIKEKEKEKKYIRTDRIVTGEGLVYYQKIYKE